ncbi:MAG: DUF1501 domain-containing protein [Gemmataceae bacterium]|nr:DUF1501 domain-containing protein [Gemmataceae bacterium]
MIPSGRQPNRREILSRAGGGLAALALAVMEGKTEARASYSSSRPTHFTATAKNVIWVFIDGGPSHVDLFDPKPKINTLAGQPLPPSFKRPVTAMGKTAYSGLLPSKRKFKQHGQSGMWISDWLPSLAKCADHLTMLKGCWADGLNHVGSVCQMNTGSVLGGRPCLGSWAAYGLGSECDNLPAFVVLQDYPEEPPGGGRNWSTGFMPSLYQGTRFREGKSPVLHLAPGNPDPRIQKHLLDYLRQVNRQHLEKRQEDLDLQARLESYELAYRMQAAAPEAVDLAGETAATHALYGTADAKTERMGRNCLMARRLVERGVRFVQIYCGSGSKWDAHTDVEANHGRYCAESDRPVAALILDLKQRGLLDSTLVIWGGEFGRTPMSESGNGRDHNPFGFSMWMAGGGVKPGMVHGATDELGLYAIEGKAHVHDVHATILHLLGMNHIKLTYHYGGRDERLTINDGHVIEPILA